MKRIFGFRKERPPPPTLEQASDKINSRGDTLDEKIRKLDAQLLQHRETIKKLRPGAAQEAAKRRALSVLKQKRLYEGQRDQLYNQQYNLEQTNFAVSSVQDSVHTVKAMAAAGKELSTVMKSKELRIENIEKMQDNMQDLLDMQNEITDILGQSYAVPDEMDESELMDELDALEDELALETEEAPGAMPAYLQEQDLPAAPTRTAPQAQEEDYGLPAVPPMPQRN
ncbi:Snf7-like protein [Helicosporidium sp. ATCC 50920]|nr:Snf7-like protein [Helicosporidium sp. ATCC 50920]|eukprot:KDD77069.1 Snf7-like protein [Helicosporidium sp. ATCC 50920]